MIIINLLVPVFKDFMIMMNFKFVSLAIILVKNVNKEVNLINALNVLILNFFLEKIEVF